ncbi:hypothetical protein BSZ32_04795 [Rubritalea profundi]|uniref:Uncharacterized protein n=2 Tax=Rubritalea profundi TaxID=1658618 RepID=A0A2S7U127_9BACT|nr:hypothetical protein BSZ32_04795 [Rubritalea profundi]
MTFMLGTMLSSSAQNAPEELSFSNFKEIRNYVIGDTAEPEYFKVDWKDNVLDGVVDAMTEDKPILLWLYFGGPLGNC